MHTQKLAQRFRRSIRPRFTGCGFAAAVITLVLSAAFNVALAESPLGADELKFFESRVRPILAEHCWKCHGQQKQSGGLRLDSRAAALAGGETGPAIAMEDPQASLLLSAINYDALEMPPTGKLDEASIATLTDWVRLGAPWPASEEGGPEIRQRGLRISDADRAYWAFQPLSTIEPPQANGDWARTPIDHFIQARLQEAGLQPAAAADKITLIRRLYFDLWGLPPSPEEIDEFLQDQRPDAYAQLVDRLLDDPRYGQRWARHWLDLVRYAESDGYKQDGYRPQAWRYRDYVIQSFNDDKPYNQFVLEQLAGDEVAPHDLNALVATGFLRHTIYEYNQRDARGQWDLMLNELTDVTADVFLGVGLSCARCHDHKFDPFLQEDYFRLRAFFEPVLPRDDLPCAIPSEWTAYQQQLQRWEEKTQPIRQQLDEIEQPIRQKVIDAAINKFPKDVRPLLRKSPAERSPDEQQLAELANRQILLELKNLDIAAQVSDDVKPRWRALRADLALFDFEKPAPLPSLFSVTDVGPIAPATCLPGKADEPILPGVLSVLDAGPAAIETLPNVSSTGRRTALARWIGSPSNPLSTRVIVNRVWQYHFGAGLVATSSDFGRLGELPSHPELLDWLARRFIADGWSCKQLHRLILNSATYQQSSRGLDVERGQLIDPRNRLLWHMPVRRLDAEQIRDALLAVSGELRERRSGPSESATAPVRSIFTRILRNSRDPLLDAFDAPDAFTSLSLRNTTTTPTQSLLMINSELTLDRAESLARTVIDRQRGSADPTAGIQFVYRRTLGRAPRSEEVNQARSFLQQQTLLAGHADADHIERQLDAWADLCHVLLNSSEFIYVE